MSHLFTVYSQKTKTLRITSCNLEILSVRKRALTEGELSWSSKERPPSSTTNQLLRNKIQGLDAWFHVTDLEKALKLDWTCTPFVDPKINNSQNWSMWHLMRQIPKLFGPGLLEICQQNSDDDTILQMISSVYDLDDIWTLDKKKNAWVFSRLLNYMWLQQAFHLCTLLLMWGTTPRKVLPGMEGSKPLKFENLIVA